MSNATSVNEIGVTCVPPVEEGDMMDPAGGFFFVRGHAVTLGVIFGYLGINAGMDY